MNTTKRYDTTKQWYAIHTYSGYEEKVAESIRQRAESLDMNDKNSVIFHGGTIRDKNKVLTSGGRVLGVTALGDTLQTAISNAYLRVKEISWPAKYYRTDIGKKGLMV